MKTLLKIWEENGWKLPFAASHNLWSKGNYVVVMDFREFRFSTEKRDTLYPFGVSFTDGTPSYVFNNYKIYNEHYIIPRSSQTEWEHYFLPDTKPFKQYLIHDLNNYIFTPKFIGVNIQCVIENKPLLIKELLLNIDLPFALNEKAMRCFMASPVFEPKLYELNKRKAHAIKLLGNDYTGILPETNELSKGSFIKESVPSKMNLEVEDIERPDEFEEIIWVDNKQEKL